jgi:uncharacterized protein (TIGR03083 family)
MESASSSVVTNESFGSTQQRAAHHARTRDAVRIVAGRVAELLRHMPDTSLRIPNAQWTVGEAAAHIAETQRLFGELLLNRIPSPYGDGSCTLEDFAPVNLEQVTDFAERDGTRLARLITERTLVYLEASRRYGDDEVFRIHFGDMDHLTVSSYMLVHLLMHGCPIAAAAGRPLPIEPSHVELTLPFLKHVIPWLYADFRGKAKRGPRGTIEFRIRGGGILRVRFEDTSATASIAKERSRADCYVSADPVAFFLVAVGVVGQWGPIAKGGLVAWGRKPELALRFKTYLPNP